MLADRIAGVLVFVLGVAYWSAASALPRPLLQQEVGPEVFPHLIAGALMLLGGQLAVGPLLRRLARKPTASPRAPEADGARAPDVPAILLVLVGLALYALLYERLGFIVATTLFMAFVIVVLEVEPRRWAWAAPLVVLFPVLIYLLFTRVLGVSLPVGVLG